MKRKAKEAEDEYKKHPVRKIVKEVEHTDEFGNK